MVVHGRARPGEHVDAERMLAGLERERHGGEEAALEGADLEQIAGDAARGLMAHQMPADRGGETRRHSADAHVAVGQESIEPRVAAGDVEQGVPRGVSPPEA
jgi:hypothetical protein